MLRFTRNLLFSSNYTFTQCVITIYIIRYTLSLVKAVACYVNKTTNVRVDQRHAEQMFRLILVWISNSHISLRYFNLFIRLQKMDEFNTTEPGLNSFHNVKNLQQTTSKKQSKNVEKLYK